jgi:hypothetical protein
MHTAGLELNSILVLQLIFIFNALTSLSVGTIDYKLSTNLGDNCYRSI